MLVVGNRQQAVAFSLAAVLPTAHYLLRTADYLLYNSQTPRR